MSVLQAQALTIGYTRPRQSAIKVAEGIHATLKAGELVCLLGPNGAGKSTLLRTLAGMQTPLQGKVSLLGNDVFALKPAQLARHLSLVLTTRPQVGLLTGYALIALGRHPHTSWTGRLSRHDEAVIRWAVAAVGAEALAPRRVAELSDGERQKIMIARALAQEPTLMLLDEPTAFLDLPHRVEIMRLLRHLAADRAILLSTHDLDLALRMADKIWLLPHFQVGTPEDLVLNGAFEQTFHSNGVHFDAATGAFKMQQASQGYVRLIGEGVRALWTARALERAGYSLTSNGHQVVATVEVSEAGYWQTHTPSATSQQHSIDDLLATIQTLTSNFTA